MTKINAYILSLLLIVSATGCKKFLDINQDPSNPKDVPAPLMLAPLEASISNSIAAGSASMLITSWMQQTTQNQAVPNTDVYQVNNGTFDGYWSAFYATTLINLQLLQHKAQAGNNTTYDGIAKVLFAYTLGNTTDLWGDVPDSKALQGSDVLRPSYDSQEQIYTHLQVLLDSAILQLTAKQGVQPHGDDYFYQGNTDKWIRAAYLLKARFYMHLSKAPGHTAAAQADLALAALGLAMQSNADDMVFPYTGTANTLNPVYQNFSTASSSTSVISSKVVDSLVNRKDPRLSKLVAPAVSDGAYRGRNCGAAPDPDITIFSTPGSFYGNPASGCYILNYTEAIFLKAEATLVKSGYAAASDIYRTGIKTHFMKLGIDTTGAAAQAYLMARGSLSATDAWEKLMDEKATASFLSIENYTDWRRTGYPALKLVQNAVTTTIPTRFQYPLTELTSNQQPQQSAKITDKLWWNQ
ncbi:SusD-like starch-binding protein associating with outer membrane [Chitinophaga niastensis]|uniref:SusD-like starch-binding protein associating with outer membrane n=1 Tax=Chitinophaga niastensis TaxID=536980 RepID=A0A2P8HIV6_CHINA|nr:SusD/RagB family nutrient-binding outer membrane lipoprotein [Chitinophaga niastensis]PSL46110.1 SusD-like starch-binding protein associating with outer membrane [Chitinophaga niastensis]